MGAGRDLIDPGPPSRSACAGINWPTERNADRLNVMPADPITVTLPASVARAIPLMADRLLDRMHELLERNTDGQLSPIEREELERLVEMAEFAQVFAAAVQKAAS